MQTHVNYKSEQARKDTNAELDLEIRENAWGRKALYFPFMAISDTHLGTRYSRARRLSHMLEHVVADTVKAVGDIVDLEYMIGKSKWGFPPWHRQVLAHLLRKQAQFFSGNHDNAARGTVITQDGIAQSHRRWVGKEIFGCSIADEALYKDPKGRIIKIKHGDDFDNVVFGHSKGFWYEFGDLLHAPIASLDIQVRKIRGMESFSMAASAKKLVKLFINKGLGVENEICRIIDADASVDGLLYGHSHMGGIKRTPKGKLLINDGCATDRVNSIVHDHKGTFALITWHKNRIDIVEENGHRRTVYWKQLGLNALSAQPTHIEDKYTKMADRVIRVIYRLAPPKERQLICKQRREAICAGREPPAIPDHMCVPKRPCYEEKEQKHISAKPHRPRIGQSKSSHPVSTAWALAHKM